MPLDIESTQNSSEEDTHDEEGSALKSFRFASSTGLKWEKRPGQEPHNRRAQLNLHSQTQFGFQRTVFVCVCVCACV